MQISRRLASRGLAALITVAAAVVVGTTASGPSPSVATAATSTTSTPSHAPGDVVGVGLTYAEAKALQQSVDEGHQPWRLDPVEVARAFAVGELGWRNPEVRQGDPHTVELTNPATGEIVSLQLGQPVRADSGIWVVTRVDRVSNSAGPATPVPGSPTFTG